MTVREVHDELRRERDVAYTTVMTVLQRLSKKGLAVQSREERAHRYRAAESREQLAAELMLQVLGDLDGDQARQAALLHFVEGINAAETAAVRSALVGSAPPARRSAERERAGSA